MPKILRYLFILYVLAFVGLPLQAQTDPLANAYKPAQDTNPADYPSYVWMTDSLQKVRRDSGSPGSVKWGTFYGTQNEFVDFQVHLQAPTGGVALQVVVSDFVQTAPNSFTISASSSDIIPYREYYYALTTKTGTAATFYNALGSYPDGLIPKIDPYYGQTTTAFPFTVAAGLNQSVWIDVHIPSGAPSGYYTGTVTLKNGATTFATLPVTIAVWQWPAAGFMPSTSSLPFQTRAYQNDFCHQVYSATTNDCSTFPGASGSDATGKALVQFNMGKILLDHRIGAANFMMPGYTTSFTGLETSYGALLGGTASTILPGAKLTAAEYFTNAAGFSNVSNWATEANGHSWFNAFLVNSFDEPSTSGDWSAIIANATPIHGSTPPSPAAVTTNIAAATSNGALNAIDIMIPKINDLDPIGGSLQRSSYNSWLSGSAGPTRRLWSYQSCSSSGTCTNGSPGTSTASWPNVNIDGLPVANRIFETLTFLHSQSGELYYAVSDCFRDTMCTDGTNTDKPWTSLYAYGGNGDGTLLLPGDNAHVGVSTPIWVPTMRLKYIRDGLQDYEYYKVLAANGQSAQVSTQIGTIVTNSHSFSVDPTVFQAARQTLGTTMHNLTSFSGGGTQNIYIAATSAGGATGADCADAKALTFFNNAANWGTGAGQINAGTVVHFCGTLTAGSAGTVGLTFQGSGASGNPITLLLEGGAILQSPQWDAAILAEGKNNITIDAGANGIIQNTLAGSSGATCLGGTCTIQSPSCTLRNANVCSLIDINGGTGVTIKGFHLTNAYVHSGTAGDGGNSDAIYLAPSAQSNILIQNNTCINSHACLLDSYSTLNGLTVQGLKSTHQVWGIFIGDNNGGSATNVDISGSDIEDFQNWAGPSLGDNGFHADGIFFQATNTGSTFTNSTIHNNKLCGPMYNPSTGDIYLSGTPGGLNTIDILNNILCMPANTIGHSGDDAEGLIVVGFNSKVRYIANNTGTSSHPPFLDIRDSGSAVTGSVENNIAEGLTAGAMYTAILNKNNSNLSGKMQTNLYFNVNTSHLFQNGDGTTNYTSLASWQMACSCDTGSAFGDPILGATTYAPGTGSAAVGLGTNLYTLNPILQTDYNGVARQSTGAFVAGAVTTGTAPAPVVSLTPSPLPFGNVTVGATSTLTETVSNTGNANLVLSATPASATAPYSIASGGSCTPSLTVAPGTNCTVKVTFSPATAGSTPGTLSIAGNASGSVGLTGTGTQGSFSFSPSPAAFPSTTVNGVSSPISIVVLNSGTASLSLSSTFASLTDSTNFHITGGTCTGTTILLPAQSCTIAVVFGPLSVANFSAHLNVFAGSITAFDILTGSGTAQTVPASTITPTTFTFPGTTTVGAISSIQTFTVLSTGTAPVAFRAPVATSTDPEFNVLTSGSCPVNGFLAVGAPCTIDVSFQPTSAGTKNTTLTLNSTGSSSAALTATAAAPSATMTVGPSSLGFPNTTKGTTSAALTLTIGNSGTGPFTFATPLGVTSGGQAGDFAITGGTCSAAMIVNPGTNCTVFGSFTPSTNTLESTTLTISSTGTTHVVVPLSGTGTFPVGGVSPTSVNYGNVTIGTTSPAAALTISNTGNADLVFQTPIAVLGGSRPGSYAFGGSGTTCSSTVVAGSSCILTVTYTANRLSAETATLTLKSNVADIVVSLSGAGIAATTAAVQGSPNPDNAGSVIQGVTGSTRTITILNSGNVTWQLASDTITGANAADFAILGTTCSGDVAPGSSCNITYTFTPGGVGSRTATLNIGVAQDVGNYTLTVTNSGGTSSYSLASNPPAPSLTSTWSMPTNPTPASSALISGAFSVGSDFQFPTPTSFLVNSVAVTPKTLIFYNTALGGGSGAFFNGSQAYFSLFGSQLYSGVESAPSMTAGTFTLGNGATPLTASTTVTLNGTGTAATRTISIVTSPTQFADTQLGNTSAPQTLTVTNTGNSPLTLAASNAITKAGGTPADFNITGGTCGNATALIVGGQCTITGTFSPTLVGGGPESTNLTVSTSSSTSATAILQGQAVVALPGGSPTIKTIIFALSYQKVSLTGSNFVPGKTIVSANSTPLPTSCTSSTACTATLPASLVFLPFFGTALQLTVN